MPPAFNLSQDQTLQFISVNHPKVTYSLLDVSLLSKMLVAVSGTTPGTSEHPHKLSKQIVKDLGATTFSLPDEPFYTIPTPCQPRRSTLPRRRSFSTSRLAPCKPSLVPSEPTIIPGWDDLSTTVSTRPPHLPAPQRVVVPAARLPHRRFPQRAAHSTESGRAVKRAVLGNHSRVAVQDLVAGREPWPDGAVAQCRQDQRYLIAPARAGGHRSGRCAASNQTACGAPALPPPERHCRQVKRHSPSAWSPGLQSWSAPRPDYKSEWPRP